MKKIAMLLALAMLLCRVGALADVSRGDKGEEVRFLQWLLAQTGFSEDKPDGSFGPRTEQAVKDYQASKGYEQTGAATLALMMELDEDRVAKGKAENGEDFYEPYTGNYHLPVTANYAAESHCATTVLGDIVYRDSCERHHALLEQEYALTARGDGDSYDEATALWLGDIKAMYADWAEGVPESRAQTVRDAGNAWIAAFGTQYAALLALYDDPLTAKQQELLMLKNYAGALCEVISGDLPATPDKQTPASTDAVNTESACRAWSVNAGTEFTTGCVNHAPLFAMEYQWTADGAGAEGLEALCAAWDEALSSLYDRWAEAKGDAVLEAKADFTGALALQDEALAPTGLARIAHVRVLQLDAARLCALLNGQ